MVDLPIESRITIAIQAVRNNPRITIHKASKIYHVPYATLHGRYHGRRARCDTMANSRKLSQTEEDVIVERILDLDCRSFPPRRAYVEDMANILLAERGAGRVGTNWATNFVKRRPELRTRLFRRLDYSRALCKDPDAFRAWFRLVDNVVKKYGILAADIYNFDETGFMMGIIQAGMVITSSERRHRPRQAQQGNREWVTVIQAVNSQGWAVPPFIIVAGKTHLASWYREHQLPGDWKIALTHNGWTTNEKGLEWVEHFDEHTRARSVGKFRLLILDGHESHHSMEFEEYCKKNNIVPLCMPAHSSHRLQPLDVGCFSALKAAYGIAIEDLMRRYITHISKEDFFPAFYRAFNAALTPKNIQSGFRGTGLVPFDPEYVISQLDAAQAARTPSPELSRPPSAWTSQTPKTLREAASQTVLVRNKIRAHQGSSPTSIIDSLEKAAKGMYRIMHQVALLQSENAQLQEANNLLSKRRRTKNKRLSSGETLSTTNAEVIRAEKEGGRVVEGEEGEEGRPQKRVRRGERRCGNCGETGHNTRTCKVEVETSNKADSD